MNSENRSTGSHSYGIENVISRRAVVGASGATILGLLSGSAFGQEQIDE